MMSNKWLRLMCMALAVGTVLIGLGAVAMATDFTWTGGPATEGGWTNPVYWTPDSGSGYPASNSDSAIITDPDPTPTCTMDVGSSLTIDDLTLQGVSPTLMTLDLEDNALTVADFAFGDYGALEADNNFTVGGVTTFSAGDMWIGVASTKIVDLEDVDTSGSPVHLRATTVGTLKANDVRIDAHTDAATRGLAFTGGTWTIDGSLLVKAAQTSGSYIAKLWVKVGTINIAISGGTNGILELDGGNATGRRFELDIDDTLTAEETIIRSGLGAIDVASGKTVLGGAVTFKPGAVVTKTGAGTFKSGS